MRRVAVKAAARVAAAGKAVAGSAAVATARAIVGTVPAVAIARVEA